MNLTNKEKYWQFYNENKKNFSIFQTPFWLDTVCGENNWDVLIYEKGGKIFGAMPYFLQKRMIFKIITMPKLTQFLGPIILYSENQKYYKKLSWENKILEYFTDNLPKNHYFINNFSGKISNLLSFFWKGYDIKVRYTYRILKNIDLERLEKEFETDIRRRRRKAEKLGLEIVESGNIQKFFELNKLTFGRQKKKIPYNFEFIQNLFNTCKKNNCGKLLLAKTKDGEIISGGYFVYDDNDVYYLMGGIHPDYKDLGGMDLLLYEGIKFALENGKNFDFEGSMVKSIEKYFRSFGAKQTIYYQVEKNNLPVVNKF